LQHSLQKEVHVCSLSTQGSSTVRTDIVFKKLILKTSD
jgi:hypothetical protein